MNCEIIAIGTELLLGDIVNTNARYLSIELAKLGINVFFQTVVGDNMKRAKEAFEIAFQRADLVITSGGLGPTDDDITRDVAAEYFGKKLVMDKQAMEQIEGYFNRTGSKMTDNNIKQSMVPEGSTVMYNDKGTAPGIIVEEGGKILILLPGPPFELENMFEKWAFPYLAKKREHIFISKTLKMSGIGESALEDKIKDIIHNQTNPTIAPYAKSSEVILRITAKAVDEEEAEKLIKPVSDELYNRLSEYIYGEDETTLEQAIVELLKAKGLTIATAESCTGGLVSGRITDVSGASGVFKLGVAAYSNEAKINILGVKEETIEKFGAVSGETAAEMAAGVCGCAGADIGISVTGVAGPAGGTEDKPVGLVYIGCCINGKTDVTKYNFSGDRLRVRQRTVVNVLNLLRKAILSEHL